MDGKSIKDALPALLGLVFGIALIAGAWNLPPSRFEPMGPAGMPRIVGIALIVLAALEAIRVARLQPTKPIETPDEPLQDTRVTARKGLGLIVFVVLTFGYLAIVSLGWLSFIPASVLFLFSTGLVLTKTRSAKTLLLLAVVALVIGAGSSRVLQDVLLVRFPGA